MFRRSAVAGMRFGHAPHASARGRSPSLRKQPSKVACANSRLGLASKVDVEPSTSGTAEERQGDKPKQEEDTDEVVMEQLDAKRKLWKAAIKLPMYWVAVIPVLVGASLAFFEHGMVSVIQTCCLLGAAILIIAWLNLSNDAFDAQTGVDVNKPESVVNLTGNRRAVLLTSILFFVAGVTLLVVSIKTINFGASACLLAFSLACGYLYQGPPFRWSYKGLGEALCFFAFGPSATTAFFMALSPVAISVAKVPMSVWICSVMVGITTSIVLFCSHFHQYEGDKAAGKLSPIVRLGGPQPALKFLHWWSYFPFAVLVAGVFAQYLPWTLVASAGMLSLPRADKLVHFANENYLNLGVLRKLKIVALGLHSSFGSALCLGLILPRLMLLQ